MDANTVLINNWNAGRMIGVHMSNIRQQQNNYGSDPYLFLRKELGVTHETWEEQKRQGNIRHCKVWNNKFLDYVVRKEFNTLEDWLADCGASLDDVLYGVNRVHKVTYCYNPKTPGFFDHIYGQPTYIPLTEVLTELGWVKPTVTIPKVTVPTTAPQDLTEMIDLEMRLHGLTIRNVYVAQDGDVMPWNTFMNYVA